MTWKVVLSIVLWVVVGFGQDFVVETLPSLPSHTSIKTIGTTAKGEISLLAMTETGYVGLWYNPKTGWSVNRQPKNVLLAVPITWEKINEDGSVFQTNITSLKDEVFVSVGFPPKYMLGYNLPQTAARFSSTAVLIPCVGLIDNYLYPTSVRGEFPSLDGKIYYSALNTRMNTVGIYSYNGNPQVADCSLKEEFLTDPSFDLGQVWKEKSGTFLVERIPRPATSVETEIVRISPNGDSTVIMSSTHPAKITTAVCCDLVFDPDNWQKIASYKDKDGMYHVVVLTEGTPKEVYSAMRWNLRPITLKGSYALLAVNEYLGNDTPGKFDSFVLVNIETRESWTVFGPTTVPGIVKAAVNPFWASIDALGSTYILLTDPKDSAKDRVVKISFPPLPPLLMPKLENLGTVAPEATVVVTGVGLTADKATTTVSVNDTEVPTTVENGVLTFMAPVEPGEYIVTVRVKNVMETVESEKMTLVVSADPLYSVGTIQEIVSIYGETESPAPNKIMVLKGQNLCSEIGCVVRVGGVASTQQSVKTDENGSTITFVVPSELSLGQQTVIVEKISAEGTLINRSKPFVTEIVASAPTFLRSTDDPSYFLIQNEKGIVNGDNPANTGDTLTGWVTGRGTEKFSLTIDDREIAYEIISDERIGLEQIKFVMPETIWYGSNIKFAPPEKIFWFNTNPPPPPIPVVE